ncbi:hypothetical protein [uncultured Chryseobacterium sp.]|uniref:hypothetical protein n=1 Tax=uncultured Chryseobacterium sp. TaxID=259322 RepID=UPI0025F542A5|nr:hypothetical protein [uncultured Chryseobacterium sp.]
MKAFWNKICRIFGIKVLVMPKKSTQRFTPLRKIIWKIITGDTEPEIMSDKAAKILSDKRLSKDFARALMKNPDTPVVKSENGKVYTYKKERR